MATLNGINLAMQTPFKEDGSVDYDRFVELVDIYLDTGMHGFVFSSGTGQHAYMTEDECNKLFELGIKRIDGRANVICQTSALNQDEVIRRSKSARDFGADALMVLPPFFEGPTDDDGIFAFYETINDAVQSDIIGYNIPQATGIELSPALFARLNQLDHFAYIKESSGDLCKQQALIAVGGKVLNGADPTTPFALMAGAPGAIWGGANYMPREAVQLYELINNGQLAAALELWQRMFPSINYIWQNDYIPAVKAACNMLGFDGGAVRAPVREIPAEAKVQLEATLHGLKN